MGVLDGKIVGFVGTDHLGKPLAKRIRTAGAKTYAFHNIPATRYDFAREGINLCESPAEVADKTSGGAIILTHSDQKQLSAMMEGENSFLEHLTSGTLVIDMGAGDPDVSKEYKKAAQEKGAIWISAPISADESKVASGDLEIQASASDNEYTLALPILNCLGKSISRVDN
ncbi:NAD(P)-binding domain-containing protein [Sneathiella aquimaris]|uniref:NAD(P)-binding domain-containing protein n=1 Tax=Sneathiella aquimaris TaxID=2599305 RepID=UPI00146C572E|nr:NAD(P)-binding domain-containing protein [Sneathiella aquimaris]